MEPTTVMAAELGETTNPRLLVPGNPDLLRRSADTLTRMGNALIQAGEGLRKLDTGGWHGPAADAFHEYFDGEPTRWLTSGDAFHQAAAALTDYIPVFEWAQREAEQAAAVWEHGKKLSDDAFAQYQADVARAEEQAHRDGSAAIPRLERPGTSAPGSSQRAAKSSTAAAHGGGRPGSSTRRQSSRSGP